MSRNPFAVLDVQRVAKLVTKTWWQIDKFRPEGVTRCPVEKGAWAADGSTCWYFEGTDSEWLRLTLEADAIAHGAKALSHRPVDELVANALAEADSIAATNMLLYVGGGGMVRMFVGPGSEVTFVPTSRLEPVADVMGLRWQLPRGDGIRPIVGSTLTEPVCMVMPIFVPGKHAVLARAWRSWDGEDLLGGSDAWSVDDEDDTGLDGVEDGASVPEVVRLGDVTFTRKKAPRG